MHHFCPHAHAKPLIPIVKISNRPSITFSALTVESEPKTVIIPCLGIGLGAYSSSLHRTLYHRHAECMCSPRCRSASTPHPNHHRAQTLLTSLHSHNITALRRLRFRCTSSKQLHLARAHVLLRCTATTLASILVPDAGDTTPKSFSFNFKHTDTV